MKLSSSAGRRIKIKGTRTRKTTPHEKGICHVWRDNSISEAPTERIRGIFHVINAYSHQKNTSPPSCEITKSFFYRFVPFVPYPLLSTRLTLPKPMPPNTLQQAYGSSETEPRKLAGWWASADWPTKYKYKKCIPAFYLPFHQWRHNEESHLLTAANKAFANWFLFFWRSQKENLKLS